MTEKKAMYGKTEIAWGIWNWMSGIDPDGDQLPLPGMPEPPSHQGVRQLPFTLHFLADPEGNIKVGHAFIARGLGVTERHLRRWLGDLIRLGVVTRETGGGRGHKTNYRLAVPVAKHGHGVSGFTATPEVLNVDIQDAKHGHFEQETWTSDVRRTRRNKKEQESLRPTQGPDGCQCDPDVIAAADLLADLIVANGRKTRPTVTCKTWHSPIHLMVTRDQVAITEVVGAIRWAQADTFWRANILSPSKLRKQYDALRLRQAAASPHATNGQATNKWSAAMDLLPNDPDRPAIEGTP